MIAFMAFSANKYLRHPKCRRQNHLKDSKRLGNGVLPRQLASLLEINPDSLEHPQCQFHRAVVATEYVRMNLCAGKVGDDAF